MFWTLHQIGCLSPSHLALFFWSFDLFFIWAIISLSRRTCYVVRGWSLRYSPGWGNPLSCAVALCGGGVREGTMLLAGSALIPLSSELSCETGSFLCLCNSHRIPELEVLSLYLPFRQPHLSHMPPCCASSQLGCPSPPLLLVWMNVSLTPWLSEFHAVWFSGISGCLLFLNWLLSFFWLCKEAQCFYPHASILARTPYFCIY